MADYCQHKAKAANEGGVCDPISQFFGKLYLLSGKVIDIRGNHTGT
ncbi:conserved hypothetical protein [delta proteobacterium NaphS2]|nr:conserved hypothetical protein [delta proteobacterium NaphS2]